MGTRLHLLDGKPYVIPVYEREGLNCNFEITYVDPGPHEIVYSYEIHGGMMVARAFRSASLEFVAAPAHRYELRKTGDETMLVEEATGEVIATGSEQTAAMIRRVELAHAICGDQRMLDTLDPPIVPDPDACPGVWFRAGSF